MRLMREEKMTKTILLVTPYIASVYDAGKYILKALSELGHHVLLWDPVVSTQGPLQDYDLAFVVKGGIDADKLKRPRVNWFPDNLSRYDDKLIENYTGKFDYFFTINKENRGIWIPGALDTDVHRPYSIDKKWDVVFLGTAHSAERVEFINEFSKRFDGVTVLFGNRWDEYGIKANPPQYFTAFAQIMSSAKIALNIHQDLFGIGVNRKVHEIAGCGSAMLLTDNVSGLEETYPMAPRYNSLDECLELTRYYLDNLKERETLVKEMQERAYGNYTYKHQVEQILKIVEEGNK